MTIDIKTSAGSDASQQFVAQLEARLLEPDLQPEERMAAGLMLDIARVYFPWFDKQHALVQDDLTMAPMVLNSACKCAATILANAVRNLLQINPPAFGFIMEQFCRDLAQACDMHVDDDDEGAEPVAIVDRPVAN